ncbi:hypothetical protein OG21DRAFT_925623 [Imleria badia]|nr:hypothetical protein OG21DRAFT_925623 [Imleria badia]
MSLGVPPWHTHLLTLFSITALTKIQNRRYGKTSGLCMSCVSISHTRYSFRPRQTASPDCGKTISRKADLPRHMKTHAENKEALKYRCPCIGCPYGGTSTVQPDNTPERSVSVPRTKELYLTPAHQHHP